MCETLLDFAAIGASNDISPLSEEIQSYTAQSTTMYQWGFADGHRNEVSTLASNVPHMFISEFQQRECERSHSQKWSFLF